MTKKSEQLKFPSELRFDLISKDWVVIATGRSRRPEMFKKGKRKTKEVPPDKCPFCQISGQEKPTLIFSRNGKLLQGSLIPRNWTTIVVPNKYPAFSPYPRLEARLEGDFYQTINAAGFHEVVITRDHKKSIARLPLPAVKELIDAYSQRFLDLKGEKFVNYVSIFHNEGREAGATIAHPHSQLITTPLIDADLRNALSNAKKYFQKTGKCIYCSLNDWERKSQKRIVFENKEFLAVCPFASKSAFEVIISPQKHSSYFEEINEEEKWQLAEAFQAVLGKLYKALNDPAYNFYLHTAPCDGKKYDYYHWHWTILPKTSTWAGFEIGTRMEISTIEPERAAEYLRKQ